VNLHENLDKLQFKQIQKNFVLGTKIFIETDRGKSEVKLFCMRILTV
jgi:hypothetical protein